MISLVILLGLVILSILAGFCVAILEVTKNLFDEMNDVLEDIEEPYKKG